MTLQAILNKQSLTYVPAIIALEAGEFEKNQIISYTLKAMQQSSKAVDTMNNAEIETFQHELIETFKHKNWI